MSNLTMQKKKKVIKLTVGEILKKEVYFHQKKEDFGCGVVKIDKRDMDLIEVIPGEVVEIIGKRSTNAIADIAYPEDVSLELIRMDELTRKNAGVGIGELVTIGKADVSMAKKIGLELMNSEIILTIQKESITHLLKGRSMQAGDIIQLKTPFKKKWSYPFDEFFDVFDRPFLFELTELKFKVINTEPAGIVRVVNTTEIDVLKKEIKPIELKVKKQVPVPAEEPLSLIEQAIIQTEKKLGRTISHDEKVLLATFLVTLAAELLPTMG